MDGAQARTTNPTVGEIVHRSMAAFTQAERRVARVLLAAYPVAGLETVAQLAERAKVSGPTVMRFVSKLGFHGYPEFQRALRDEVQARISSPLSLYELRPSWLESEVDPQATLEAFVRNLETTFRSIPPVEFQATLDLLADPRRRIVCTGGRFTQVAAYYLYAHLHVLRSGARFIGAGPVPRSDELIDMGRRDVLAVFDYRRYQVDTIELARRAAGRGATLVLFTDPWLSPIAEVAHHVLPASVEVPWPFDSIVAGLAVVEALVAGLVARLGDGGRRRMERLEELRTGFTWGEALVGPSREG